MGNAADRIKENIKKGQSASTEMPKRQERRKVKTVENLLLSDKRQKEKKGARLITGRKKE